MKLGLLLSTVLISFQAQTAFLTIDEVLNNPSSPLILQTQLNEKTTIQKVEAKKGGVITLKGENGAEYILDLPARSLPKDLHIRLTEIKELKVQGDDNPIVSTGLQIHPDGIQLNFPATLTIKTKSVWDKKTLSAVTSDNDGGHGHTPAFKSIQDSQVTLGLVHFSNYALSDEKRMQEYIDFALDNQEKTRLNDWLNRHINMLVKSGDADKVIPLIEKALLDAYDRVVKSKIGSVQTCEGAAEAVSTYLNWERQGAIIGIDAPALIGDPNKAAFTALRSKKSSLCVQKARQLCHVEHKIVPAILLILDVSREAELFSDPDTVTAATEMAEKCMQFKFFMQTEMWVGESRNDSHGISVQTEFDFKFGLGATLVSSVGFLKENGVTEPIHDFQLGEVKFTDFYLNNEPMVCNRNSLSSIAGPMAVDNFVADMLGGRGNILRIQAPDPRGQAKFTCVHPTDKDDRFTMSLPPSADMNYFQGMFWATHGGTGLNEMDLEGNFILKNAVYREAPKMFEAQYNISADGIVNETSTYIIYHTPQD